MSLPLPEPSFPLTIKLDPNGLEWTHLIGMQQHTKTPGELPSALETLIFPIIMRIAQGRIQEFVVHEDTMEEATEAVLSILRLTAWWLEWDRRRVIAHGAFDCTHCKSVIPIQKARPLQRDKHIYRCPNRECPTHALVSRATGDPVLTVVEETKSA